MAMSFNGPPPLSGQEPPPNSVHQTQVKIQAHSLRPVSSKTEKSGEQVAEVEGRGRGRARGSFLLVGGCAFRDVCVFFEGSKCCK